MGVSATLFAGRCSMPGRTAPTDIRPGNGSRAAIEATADVGALVESRAGSDPRPAIAASATAGDF